MLYDRKWDVAAEDVFTLAGLTAWLEKQNPNQNYNWYSNNGGCLISTYLGMNGFRCIGDYGKFCDATGADELVAEPTPHTYGAALGRARKFLKK